jgi:hypothetical protein
VSLRPLPAGYTETRQALHALAEHVLAPSLYRETGKIGLRATPGGFGTPIFDGDRQLRVEGGVLVDGDRRGPITTLRAAGEFARIEPGAPADVYVPATPNDGDAPLAVCADAARALGEWFALADTLLEQLRSEAAADDDVTIAQLWPEHFDLAVALGPKGARANYGGSPGDGGHAEPYLYVGPFEPRDGDFWSEGFGASLSYREILDGADPLEFLRRGRELLKP